jgi:transcriptional regulator with AAA-type ATPase domain/transcriptional regulatory protein LevR
MRKDRIFEYVISRCEKTDCQDELYGVLAQEVADALKIWRNDVAVELNRLVAEGKLCRSGKKNVRFYLPGKVLDAEGQKSGLSAPHKRVSHSFSKLVGVNGSLKYQIRVAKAAVSYPTQGLNMLITGPTGTGKSRFARAVWEYAKEAGAFNSMSGEIPFVVFNCAEYADNPQLLLSNLFGYKKGAFTGAVDDKTGLVEEAKGGILLLDEIHCLSSTSQELFFTLLDSGIYRPIGENTRRESHFMLIGATTKCVTDTLLDTFLRRMPVLIQMPCLAERPHNERMEFIEYFYAQEAARINRAFRIKKEVLNTLMAYTIHADLGSLKNVIQISCAKGYLKNTSLGESKNKEIQISFSDLSFQAFTHDWLSEYSSYSDTEFLDDLLIPAEHFVDMEVKIPAMVDIYDFVEKKLDLGLQEGLSAESLQQMIAREVDNYYEDLNKMFREQGTDTGLLNSIIPPGIIRISAEFLSMASTELSMTYSATAPLLLAMHISQYIDRIRSEQPVFPPDFRKMVKGYFREMAFLRKKRQWLMDALKVKISDDELDFLTIFLQQVANKQKSPGIWITLVSCNESTASSMGRFASSIYHINHVHWIDNKFANDIMGNMFQLICDNIKAFHGEGGNLIFTDSKVLSGLEQELYKSTGVKCRVIPLLEQHMIMDACRITLAADHDLDEIFRRIVLSYHAVMTDFFNRTGVGNIQTVQDTKDPPGEQVVITVCVTGVGSARSIKEILERKLFYIPNLRIISMSSLEDINRKSMEYGKALKLIVGTVNPYIPDITFLPADRVFTANGIYCISSILDEWNFYTVDFDKDKPEGDELDHILSESFNLIAPSVYRTTAIACISKMRETLESGFYKKKMPEEIRGRLFMHAASMLERITTGQALEMEDEHEIMLMHNKNWFDFLDRIIQDSFSPLRYEIPRSEIFFFMLSLPETIN